MYRNILFAAGVAALSCLSPGQEAAAQEEENGRTFEWNTTYVGGTLGWTFCKFLNQSGVVGPAGCASSPLGGVQLGTNWQCDYAVTGLEVDFMGFKLRAKSGDSKYEQVWQSTVRARVGYPWEQLLGYVTGGLVMTSKLLRISGSGTTRNIDASWCVGCGVEAVPYEAWLGRWISEHVSTRLEYLYLDCDPTTQNVGATSAITGSSCHQIRWGFNYHL